VGNDTVVAEAYRVKQEGSLENDSRRQLSVQRFSIVVQVPQPWYLIEQSVLKTQSVYQIPDPKSKHLCIHDL
jgi:hypothetical protein